MSWSVSENGTKEDCMVKVDADIQTPESIKVAVSHMLAAVLEPDDKNISLSTNGHLDSNGGSASISMSVAKRA